MRFFILHSIFFFLSVSISIAEKPFTRVISLHELGGNNQIEVMMQCSRGFLWLGARQGLYLYDSYRMEKIIFPLDSAYHITAIYEAPNKTIWIGTAGGQVFSMLPHFQKPELWLPEEGLPKLPITGFAQTKDQTFWFSTYGEGVYYVQDKRMYNLGADDGLNMPEIYGISPSDDSSIWFIADDGLYRFHARFEKKNLQKVPLTEPGGQPIFRSFSASGEIWAGAYDEGLFKLSPSTGKLAKVYQAPGLKKLKKVVSAANGLVYLLTERGEIFEYDPRTNRSNLLHIDVQYRHAGIHTIFADNKHMLWVATKGGHLLGIHLEYRFFETTGEELLSIMEYNDSTLIAGTGTGIYRITFQDGESYNRQAIIPALKVHALSILKDDEGFIYVATFDDGLFIIHPNLVDFRQLSTSNGLINNSILSMTWFKNQLWCATLGGAMSIDFKENPAGSDFSIHDFSSEGQTGAQFIYQLYADSKDQLWFATDGNGLLKLDTMGNFTAYREACGQSFKTVYSVVEDINGNIWFSTPNDGIYNLYTGENCHYTTENGLQHKEIAALFASPDGYLHIVFPDGINALHVEKGNLHYKNLSGSSLSLDQNLNAYSKGGNQNVWLAASNGIVRWLKHPPYTENTETVVSWKSITGNNQLLSWDDEQVSLNYKNHFISFHYAAVNFDGPLQLTYRYKLEGLDMDWKHSKDDHVTYVGLKPGTYRFIVSSGFGNQFPDQHALAFEFTIKPPWWRTWWFILLATGLVIYITFLLIKFRDGRIKQIADQKKFQVETQFELLKNQVKPHFLFNSFNTLAGMIEENPEHAVVYVEKMSDLYRSILQYHETDLIEINEELRLLEDYYFLLKQRYGERLEMHINLNDTKGFIAPLTLQLLVENAVKHNTISSGKKLKIEIEQVNNEYIQMSNNYNPKRQQEPSTGFGLKGIKARYEILSGKKVSFELTNDRFTVKIPIIGKNGL